MQWAYSELFQNYSGTEVAWYLDYANRQSARIGSLRPLFSETHDNDRLARKRPRLVAAAKPSLRADQSERRIRLHLRRRMARRRKNPRPRQHRLELGQRRQHRPRTRATQPTDLRPSLLFRRRETHALERARFAHLRAAPRIRRRQGFRSGSRQHRRRKIQYADARARRFRNFKFPIFKFDLLGQPLPTIRPRQTTKSFSRSRPARAHCLAPTQKPAGLSGDDYRRARAQAAWAIEALSKIIPAETIDGLDWRWLAEQVERVAEKFSRRRQPNSPRATPKLRSPICCAKLKPEKFSRASSPGLARRPPRHARAARPLAVD